MLSEIERLVIGFLAVNASTKLLPTSGFEVGKNVGKGEELGNIFEVVISNSQRIQLWTHAEEGEVPHVR